MSASEPFEVVISGSGSNLEEWARAQSAPAAELRVEKLTEDEKHIAARFGISLERYARGILALRYGRERRESEGRALGQHVVEFLRELGEGYRLTSVLRDMDRLRWVLRVQTPKGTVSIPVGFELSDDVLEPPVLAQVERFRRIVLEGVGRKDLAAS